MLGVHWHHQRSHGPLSYRLRITNLPATYSRRPRHNTQQLQAMIFQTHGVAAHGLHMSHHCTNRRGDRAWAFLEVSSEPDGNHLITNIGLARFDGAPLRIEWSHDSLLGMTTGSAQITIVTYPNLVFHQHPRFGTFRVTDMVTGVDLPYQTWPTIPYQRRF